MIAGHPAMTGYAGSFVTDTHVVTLNSLFALTLAIKIFQEGK